MSKNGSVNIILIFILLLFFCPLSNSADSKQKVGKYIDKIRTKDVVRAKFGSGPDQIGVVTPSEANPEGPMSFAIGKEGEIYILDQLNSRVQIFKEGKRTSTISISAQKSINFKDIALMADNKIVLLGASYVDGKEKSSLYFFEASGKILNLIKLEDGRLIPDSIAVTGIQIIKEGKFAGIWVEIGEGRSVRVASLDGKSVERISVPGRFSCNGKRLFRIEKIGEITAVVHRSEEDSLSKWEPERTVNFEMEILHLLGIWDDQKGKIHLGAFLEDANKKGKSQYANVVVIFSSELKELGRVKLAVQESAHEIWYSIRVSPNGHIYQMFVDKQDVVVRKYEF